MHLRKPPDNDKYIKIYKGKSFVFSPKKMVSNKVIVFDLDETIGSFGDLYIVWGLIEQQISFQGNCIANFSVMFDSIVDLYPEFFRYGILNILEFLYHKKISGECSRIFIYTNNQCTHFLDKYSNDKKISWVESICLYISKKIGLRIGVDINQIKLFDKIIGAFKIGGKIVEFSRTTNSKNVGDLFKCAIIPKNTEICFIDNTYYSGMIGDRVYYIKPRSYNHSLSHSTIIDRFIYSDIGGSLFTSFFSREDFSREFLQYSYKECKNQDNTSLIHRVESDLLISQRLMYYLKEFFYLSNRNCKKKTCKFVVKMGKYTRKKRKL